MVRLAMVLLWLACPAAAQEFATLNGHGGPIWGLPWPLTG